jgi:CRISPR/Cas system CSM-associated protein Csm4 (group 5 of RAMP superfamily)
MITAVNKKNQKLVSKAYNYLAKYDQNNTLRDMADDQDDQKAYKKYDRICIDAFDKYLEALAELPKREADRIEKIYYK